MTGWLLTVIARELLPHGRWRLRLSCGCQVTRRTTPNRCRCELQRACKWRQP